MRRSYDVGNAVLDGGLAHRNGGLQIRGTVVETGQDVAVNIDHYVPPMYMVDFPSYRGSPHMSEYKLAPLDFSKLRTVPLAGRPAKVTLANFGQPHAGGVGAFLHSPPHLLAADEFRALAAAILGARKAGRAILWGLGGHVIKCGLAPVLIDLMDRGCITGLAGNGAASIHDIEIALAGATSEEVDAVLTDGRFGTAEETAATFHGAAADALR